MSKSTKTCKYIFIDLNKDEYPCTHNTFGYSDYCIFHYQRVNEKRKRFYKEFDKLVNDIQDNPSIIVYDFKGFIFPYFEFSRKTFIKDVDFRKASFKGSAVFEGVEFKKEIIFHSTHFEHKVNFQGANFIGKSNFIGVKFYNKAIFRGGTFNNKVVFHGCHFKDLASFQDRGFNNEAIFQSNTFYEDADFRKSKFYSKVDFSLTRFKGRASFEKSNFHNEVKAENVRIASLSKLDVPGINLNGAVLESANFYEMPCLKNFSFKNGFLISCNLSDKEIINCNFSGAVLKTVHTKNWKVDNKTLENTEFIYSDYKISTINDDGSEEKCYEPKKESRVPSKGVFGDENNKDFTLITYFKEPYKWDYLLDFPPTIRTGLINYLNFFKDYLKAVENIDLDIATHPEGEKLRITFMIDNKTEESFIKDILTKYIINIFKPFDKFQVEFRNPGLDDHTKNLMLINYQNELNTTQTRLKFGLQNSSDKMKTLDNLLDIINTNNVEDKNKLYALADKLASGLVDSHKVLSSKQPVAEARISADISMKYEVKSEINLNLSKLFDSLNLIGNQDSQATKQIEFLKNELDKLINDFGNDLDKKTIKERFKPIFKGIKGLTEFGIKNVDNIIKLGEYISKCLS